MIRKYLTPALAALALGTAGCASSGRPSFRANPFASFRSEPKEQSSTERSVASSWKNPLSRTKEAKEELSPEFRAAQKTLKKHPEKTLIAWARYQEDIGEYAEARKMYHELQIAYPDNTEAHLGMARVELLTGRSQQAEEILAELMDDHPDDVNVRLAFGRLYTELGRLPEAIGAFEEACEIEPQNQDCRYELGIAYARAGNFDQAISHLTFSVGESAAHYNIGYILHEQGRDAEAVEWFRDALQQHPDQQTAQKSNAMLAKLSPMSQDAAGSQMIARQPSSHRRAAAIAEAENHFASEEETPVVLSSGQREAVRPHYRDLDLPPVEDNATGRTSPFRTASYNASPPNEADSDTASLPPQWEGPAAGTDAAPSADRSPPEDPPMWRSRRD